MYFLCHLKQSFFHDIDILTMRNYVTHVLSFVKYPVHKRTCVYNIELTQIMYLYIFDFPINS